MSLRTSGFPEFVIEIAFATDPAATPTWVNVTDYVRGFSTRRGRSHELSRVEAGTAIVRLSNRDRRFDPSYAAGPYYPNVIPMRRIRIKAVDGATTYYVFSGYIERWPQTWKGTEDAEVTITAVDGFEPLRQLAVTTSYSSEVSSARISNVLNDAGWSATDRAISIGQSSVQASTLTETSALQHIMDVVEAEQGSFFIDGAGNAVFHDRHTRLKTPYTTSAGVFGDDGSELPYRDFIVSYDKDEIRNHIRVTRPGGTTQTVTDATSVTRYFKRSYVADPILTTDNEALSMAEWLLSRFKDPKLRVSEIELSARMGSTVAEHILERELGDRITTLRRVPGGGDPIEQDSFIESINHDVKRDKNGWQWVTRWSLSPADNFTYWTLGDSANGVLGTTTRLAY